MRLQQSLLALWVSLVSLCLGITISPLTGGLGMARVLFNDSKDVFSSSSGYSGDPSAMRSFTDGPFGMGKGIILSTGSLASPLAPGDTCPSSYTTDLYDAYTTTYCGADTYNGASYLLNILPTKATTLLIEMVIASCDLISADKVMVLVNGVNYAKDENGTPLTSASKYLSEPWGIPAPNGNTAFAMTSPPLRFSIPLPKTYVELKIAICDRLDGYGDTAVMIKARPCNDCDQPFEVNYDTTSIISTTTYETTSTITQPASGTVRGTISFVTFVTASATSTTSSTSSDSMSSSSLDSPTPTSSDSILSSPLDSASSNSLGSTPSAPSDSTTTTSLYSTSPTTFDSAPSTSSDSMLSTPFDYTSSNSLDLTRLTSWDSTTPTSLGSTPSATSDSALSTPSDSTSSITLPLSTAISHITASTITSSIIPAPTPCNQLDNPYYIDGVEISILCSKQTTGGNQIDFSNLFHSLTECIILCAYNLNCRAVTFDNFANGCTLYDGFNGFISDDNQDVAVVASRPALLTMPPSSAALSTTTSSSAAATASSSTPSGPLSCSQMAGTTYTGPRENKFTLSCDTSSTGASIYRRAEEDTMQGCLDRCDDDSRCIAMDFYPYPHSECRLIESYTGTTPSPGTNFASKIFSSSTTFTSSEFMQSTLSTGVSITLLPSTSLSSLSSISLEATSLSSLLLSISEAISETTLNSISATTLSVSSASTSLITTLLPSTSLSLSIGITSKTTLESALESASLLTASATSSTSSISLPTVLPPLTSILSPKSSFGPTWETASDAASTEVLSSAESTPVTSTATTDSSDTSTITTNVSTTERLTIKTPAVETSSTITPVTEIPPPATGSGLSNTSQVSIEIQSTISTLQSSDFKTISHPLSYVETTGGQTYESTSKSSSLPSSSQTGSSSSSSSLTAIDLVTKRLSVSESTITKMTMEIRPTVSYPTLNAIHTAYSSLTIDDSYTKTQFAEIVTTVTYTTIDPSNPAALITTCVPVTLLYTPCMCEHQTYPSVDMTTVACTQGKDKGIVTLTIPKAAYEIGTKNYTHPIVQYPSGWIEGVQTDAGGNSYPVVQPTTGSQGSTQPGHKKGQPETPTQATGSQGDFGHSYKSRKPTMTTSAVGFYRNNRPGQGNRQPAIPAQGSPASKSTTLMNPSRASFSNAMTTETSIMPTPQFDTSTVPPQSSLSHHGHGSSELKEAPYPTSMVLSEAHRYHLASWVVVTVVLIVIFL